MSQWITLEKLMSEYGIDREEALCWTSVEGIIHSKINGLILVDNESISTYLDENKICADATVASNARIHSQQKQELQEELIENQQAMCDIYKQIIEKQNRVLNKSFELNEEGLLPTRLPVSTTDKSPTIIDRAFSNTPFRPKETFFHLLLARVYECFKTEMKPHP